MNYTNLNASKTIALQHNENWIDVRNIEEQEQTLHQYENICKEHKFDKKWILMINPENDYLASLSQSNEIDTSKILKVNTQKTKINLENIESALRNGNCSAVILCNPSLRSNELAQLNKNAEKGKTACIVLQNSKKLH